jgi:hypothetical protein
MMFPSTRQYMDIADKSLLRNSPIERADIKAAEEIYGTNIGSLKGKTATHKSIPVDGRIAGVPNAIRSKFQSVIVAVDIMYINKIPFFLTISRGLHFGTVETIRTRHMDVVLKAVKRMIGQYTRRGFRVDAIHADPEFTPLQAALPRIGFNFCAQNEHVPDIERFIRTVKDRVRSAYNMVPFKHIPRLIISRVVANAVFWLNAFPHSDGVSNTLSPRYLLTGRHLDYKKHVRTEFGGYVQTHEQHSNDMNARTLGAICLGPSGNEQGGHYFMSISTGKRIHRHWWNELPMPDDVIDRVNQLGRRQNMPRILSFADRYGLAIIDDDDDIDNDHDSTYDSEDDSNGDDDDFNVDDYDDDDDSDANSIDTNANNDIDGPDLPVAPTGVDDAEDAAEEIGEDDESDNESNDDDDNGGPPELQQPEPDDDTDPDESDDEDNQNDDDDDITIPGVAAATEIEDEIHTPEDTSDDEATQGTTVNRRYNLRPGHRQRNYDHMYKFNDNEELFMTEQMSLNRGLKEFGLDGADAVVRELKQLDYLNAIKPVHSKKMTSVQKKDSLRYLMYLKQKRCGRVKARGCADGRKQRIYKTKEETSSPTVSIEALFLTSIIDAKEGRDVATVDIPGAFLHSDIDELIHLIMDGPMADLLVKVNPEKYCEFVVKDRNGKSVIYVELKKALYGTLQAALLFWENLSTFLTEELGFTINKYDRCTVNKIINGKQCTVVWHVDDLKLSHIDPKVLDEIIRRLREKYGQEAPLTVTRGKVHEYLGMTLDYGEVGKVKFIMDDYVKNLIDNVPSDMTGTAATPGSNHLFNVNDDAEKLSPEMSDKYHQMTAKLLYLSKRVRPDIQPTVAFMCTRVKEPDVDDWKKLGRCIRYIRGSKEIFLTLEADDSGKLEWWVDASFAVHRDFKSHTGMTISLGKGSPISGSWRQKLNTKSSTEAELVGVDDRMHVIVWTRNFLIDQGFNIQDIVVYQDNQSAILLERNGRTSSSRRTRHVNIRYFFVSDRIANKELRVEYCPTDDMWGDFMTKTLQGTKFKRMRAKIMNISEDLPLPITSTVSQECVGKPSYAEIVRGTRATKVSQSNETRLPDTKVQVASNRMKVKLYDAKYSYFATNLI